MSARTPQEWRAVFAKTPGHSDADLANRVLADLIGYRHSSKHRKDDAQNVLAAMRAFGEIMQERSADAPSPHLPYPSAKGGIAS